MASLAFSYEDDRHEYRNAAGIVRPSVTQSLTAQGIFDFSMVNPYILDNARRRGKNVHRWTAELDIYGWIDETWIADDERGYFEAWISFKHDLKPKIVSVEQPMLGLIAGIEVGGTPDRELYVDAVRYINDLKCCAAKHPGWGLQTADYELLKTGRSRCGHFGRMSTQLFPDGRYSITVYEDPTDADAAIAAVQLTEWDTQANYVDADQATATLNAWKQNYGLLEAVA